jgi:CII-binding regulator of phage lambda lysogenization HflD
MINVIVNQAETAKYLAEKMNLPEKLIRDESEQRRIVEQISELQNQAQANGAAAPGQAPTE